MKFGKGKVVHCKREDFDVYIGRPGPYGNPFTIGRDGNRKEVIDKYEEWLLGVIDAPDGSQPPKPS